MKIKCVVRGCPNSFVKKSNNHKHCDTCRTELNNTRSLNWNKNNVEKCLAATRRWRKRNREHTKKDNMRFQKENPKYKRSRSRKLKIEVLSYYGKNGKLMCCWRKCTVSDLDCLTLDHMNNNGAEMRRAGGPIGGVDLYSKLKNNDYPKNHQTLCANHQLKKELLRRRRSA